MNDAKILCMIVADGMGGGYRGEDASRTAVSAFADSFYLRLKKKYELARAAGKRLDLGFNHGIVEEILFKAVQDANRQVFKEIPPMKVSGTTLSVAVIMNSVLITANVGDSPIYYYSAEDNEIRCISRIMNRAEEGAVQGNFERYSPEYFRYSNQLTGSLGRFEEIDAYEGPVNDAAEKVIYSEKAGIMAEGDMVILGSDGAFGYQKPEQFLETLLEENGKNKLTVLFDDSAEDVDDRTAILYIQESR